MWVAGGVMGKLVTREQNNSFIGTIRPRCRHGDKVSLDRLFSDMIPPVENTTIYKMLKVFSVDENILWTLIFVIRDILLMSCVMLLMMIIMTL